MLKVRGIAVSFEIGNGDTLQPLVEKCGFSAPTTTTDASGRVMAQSKKVAGPVTFGLVRKGPAVMLSAKGTGDISKTELRDYLDLLFEELKAAGIRYE